MGLHSIVIYTCTTKCFRVVASMQAQIDWTQRVEACLQSDSPGDALQELHSLWLEHLEELASLAAGVGEVPAHRQCVVASLLTLDVHARDVIQALRQRGVSSNQDFEWTRCVNVYVHVYVTF